MAESTQPRTVSVEAGPHRIDREVKDGPRETFTVEMDTPIAEVYKKDEQGYFLSWDIDPGKFRELSQQEYSRLSVGNQSAYNALARAATVEARRSNSPNFPKVWTNEPTGTAARKLQLNQAIRGRVTGWKRPDELHTRENEGWRKASAADGYAPNYGTQSASDGIYIKTKDGDRVDLVAMDIDERLYKQQLDEVSRESKRRTKAKLEEVKEEAREIGVRAFEVDPDDPVGSGGETPRSAARRTATRADAAARAAP